VPLLNLSHSIVEQNQSAITVAGGGGHQAARLRAADGHRGRRSSRTQYARCLAYRASRRTAPNKVPEELRMRRRHPAACSGDALDEPRRPTKSFNYIASKTQQHTEFFFRVRGPRAAPVPVALQKTQTIFSLQHKLTADSSLYLKNSRTQLQRGSYRRLKQKVNIDPSTIFISSRTLQPGP
jgi:hypothetical protein